MTAHKAQALPSIPRTETPLLKLLWRVYGYLRPYWKQTLIAYASLFAILGLNTMIPQFLGWIIDTGVKGNQPQVLTWSVLVLLGLTVLKGVLNYYQGTMSEVASQNVAFDLRNEIQKKLTSLSFSFHDQSEAGELLSRAVQDVERIRFLTGRATVRILEGALLLVVTAIVMLVMDYRLALLVLATMPLLVYRALYFGSRFRPLSQLVQKQLAVLTTAVEQNLRGTREVKAYVQEDAEIERFGRENARWFDLSARSAQMQAVNLPLLFLIANLGYVAIILYGGRQVVQGQITIGEIIAFITYVGQLIEPVRRLGMIIPAVAIAGSAAERIFDILDTVSEVRDEPGAVPIGQIQGRVEFEHVSFSYGRKKVLNDINFRVEAGQTIALLGSTGSGKSTIISLVPRFYDPSEGRVLVDGTDVRKVTLHSLRSQIGIVMQDTTLFAGTIRENITFGNEQASEEEIIRAARAAQAHEFIIQSAQGYDTRVGERGVTLSGGQRQRLAIARALLMDPRILILDDATASVDAETEHLIQLAFQNLVRGRTTFVIAHRLSTVRNADQIIVMDKGRIQAMGTHETLLTSSRLYVEIYNRQLKRQETTA
ncbi:MAG TPA: ABC transporter ATP-binding protein [Anaerolineaceae bacterium]|nr:ABC transporter ATP-binding protein [Anaerolineaceae bacterium]HOH20145.1 ABC transporter ATP-binding protein [Anaerolineaceae bacterium]HQH35432.1 ABC transporter ATP-binding protein [Anaerolineaceae bacterium]HQL38976.1 ABC transporter ATP-binding protein [Anaerolineaceae bacterium]HQO97059.1 ABC transporter ATP-binding protein [Anaerolineaceae bacterium]